MTVQGSAGMRAGDGRVGFLSGWADGGWMEELVVLSMAENRICTGVRVVEHAGKKKDFIFFFIPPKQTRLDQLLGINKKFAPCRRLTWHFATTEYLLVE